MNIGNLLQAIWQFSFENSILIPPYLLDDFNCSSHSSGTHRKTASNLAAPTFGREEKSPYKSSSKVGTARNFNKNKCKDQNKTKMISRLKSECPSPAK